MHCQDLSLALGSKVVFTGSCTLLPKHVLSGTTWKMFDRGVRKARGVQVFKTTVLYKYVHVYTASCYLWMCAVSLTLVNIYSAQTVGSWGPVQGKSDHYKAEGQVTKILYLMWRKRRSSSI